MARTNLVLLHRDPTMTVRILAPELDALVSYDDRLLRAANDAGLATLSPGTKTV